MRHPTVDNWLQDPEFNSLPENEQARIVDNFFESNLADNEFRQLDNQEQARIKQNFVNAQFAPESLTRQVRQGVQERQEQERRQAQKELSPQARQGAPTVRDSQVSATTLEGLPGQQEEDEQQAEARSRQEPLERQRAARPARDSMLGTLEVPERAPSQAPREDTSARQEEDLQRPSRRQSREQTEARSGRQDVSENVDVLQQATDVHGVGGLYDEARDEIGHAASMLGYEGFYDPEQDRIRTEYSYENLMPEQEARQDEAGPGAQEQAGPEERGGPSPEQLAKDPLGRASDLHAVGGAYDRARDEALDAEDQEAGGLPTQEMQEERERSRREHTWARRAVETGTHQYGTGFYEGLKGWLGSTISRVPGLEGVGEATKRAGYQGQQVATLKAQMRPQEIEKLSDAESAGDYALWAGEQIGMFLPQMANMSLGGAVAQRGGKAALMSTKAGQAFERQVLNRLANKQIKRLTKKGVPREKAGQLAMDKVRDTFLTRAGAGAQIGAMYTGSNWSEVMSEYGVDNPWSALGTGLGASFLTAIGGQTAAVEGVLGKARAQAFKKALNVGDSYLAARIVKEFAKNAPKAAAEEFGQESLALANNILNDPDLEKTASNMFRAYYENIGRPLESAASVAVAAGVPGAVSKGVSSHLGQIKQKNERKQVLLENSLPAAVENGLLNEERAGELRDQLEADKIDPLQVAKEIDQAQVPRFAGLLEGQGLVEPHEAQDVLRRHEQGELSTEGALDSLEDMRKTGLENRLRQDAESLLEVDVLNREQYDEIVQGLDSQELDADQAREKLLEYYDQAAKEYFQLSGEPSERSLGRELKQDVQLGLITKDEASEIQSRVDKDDLSVDQALQQLDELTGQRAMEQAENLPYEGFEPAQTDEQDADQIQGLPQGGQDTPVQGAVGPGGEGQQPQGVSPESIPQSFEQPQPEAVPRGVLPDDPQQAKRMASNLQQAQEQQKEQQEQAQQPVPGDQDSMLQALGQKRAGQLFIGRMQERVNQAVQDLPQEQAPQMAQGLMQEFLQTREQDFPSLNYEKQLKQLDSFLKNVVPEGRGQRTEDRGQRPEGRGQRPEGSQEPGVRVQEGELGGGRRPETESDRRAAESQRLVLRGQEAVPGIRLQEAEETGRMAGMLEQGEISQEEWDSYVQDLRQSNRVQEPQQRTEQEAEGRAGEQQEQKESAEPEQNLEPLLQEHNYSLDSLEAERDKTYRQEATSEQQQRLLDLNNAIQELRQRQDDVSNELRNRLNKHFQLFESEDNLASRAWGWLENKEQEPPERMQGGEGKRPFKLTKKGNINKTAQTKAKRQANKTGRPQGLIRFLDGQDIPQGAAVVDLPALRNRFDPGPTMANFELRYQHLQDPGSQRRLELEDVVYPDDWESISQDLPLVDYAREAAPQAEQQQWRAQEGRQKEPWEMTRKEMLLQMRGLTQEKIDSYNPQEQPQKLGKVWQIHDIDGNSWPVLFKTKKEAIRQAEDHKQMMQDQFDNIEEYTSLERAEANHWLQVNEELKKRRISSSEIESQLPLSHKEQVRQALQQGKPVPGNVLREYQGEGWADEALQVRQQTQAAQEPSPEAQAEQEAFQLGDYVLNPQGAVGRVDRVDSDGSLWVDDGLETYMLDQQEVTRSDHNAYINDLRKRARKLREASAEKRREAAEFNKQTDGRATGRKGQVEQYENKFGGVDILPFSENALSQKHREMLQEADNALEAAKKLESLLPKKKKASKVRQKAKLKHEGSYPEYDVTNFSPGVLDALGYQAVKMEPGEQQKFYGIKQDGSRDLIFEGQFGDLKNQINDLLSQQETLQDLREAREETPSEAGVWENITAEQKQDVIKQAGWVTRQGNLNPTGKKIAQTTRWEDLSQAARNTLQGYLSDMVPQAEQAASVQQQAQQPAQPEISQAAEQAVEQSRQEQIQDLTQELRRSGSLRRTMDNGMTYALTRSSRGQGFQLTSFDQNMQPVAHTDHASMEEAVQAFSDLMPHEQLRVDLPDDVLLRPEEYNYLYRATRRPVGPGSVPRQGLVETRSDEGYGQAVYDRPLTREQLDNYELEPVGYEQVQAETEAEPGAGEVTGQAGEGPGVSPAPGSTQAEAQAESLQPDGRDPVQRLRDWERRGEPYPGAVLQEAYVGYGRTPLILPMADGTEISLGNEDSYGPQTTLKQQKDYLLQVLDYALAELKKGNLTEDAVYKFYVPWDGRFRVYGSRLQNFRNNVKNKFPTKVKKPSMGQKPKKSLNPGPGRINMGEFYNEFEPNVLPQNQILFKPDKKNASVFWDAGNMVYSNGLSLLRLQQAPQKPPAKLEGHDMTPILQWLQDNMRPGRILGEFSFAQEAFGEKVYAHAASEDLEVQGVFDAHSIDQIQSMYPEAEVYMIGEPGLVFVQDGQIVGATMGLKRDADNPSPLMTKSHVDRIVELFGQAYIPIPEREHYISELAAEAEAEQAAAPQRLSQRWDSLPESERMLVIRQAGYVDGWQQPTEKAEGLAQTAWEDIQTEDKEALLHNWTGVLPDQQVMDVYARRSRLESMAGELLESNLDAEARGDIENALANARNLTSGLEHDQYYAELEEVLQRHQERMQQMQAGEQEPPQAGSLEDAVAQDPATLEQVVAEAGLKVNKTTTNKGKPVWQVSGNTYEHKDLLKRLGGRFYKPKKAWSFFDGDPTQRIARAIAGLESPGRGADEGVSADTGPADGSPETVLEQYREREDARADERVHPEDYEGHVSQDTRGLIERGLQFGMPQQVVREQIQDVGMVSRAYQENKPLFILANEPGTGKTFVIGGAIREIRRQNPQQPIIWVTVNQGLVDQIGSDLADYGLQGISFVTYDQLSRGTSNINWQDAVVFWDEAHSVKNALGSKRGKLARQLMGQAKMNVYSSATPFENPVEAGYLEPSGVFAPLGGFLNFAKMYGASTRKIETPRGTQEIPYWSGGRPEDAAAARQWFVKQGVFTQRSKRIDPSRVSTVFFREDVDQQYVNLYQKVEQAFETALEDLEHQTGGEQTNYSAQLAMRRVNTLKRLLEGAKLPAAIRRIQENLDQGKQVVLFTETKAQRKLGLSEQEYSKMLDDMSRWQADRRLGGGPPPHSRVDMALASAFREHGIDFTLPSVVQEIAKHFGQDRVALYTGDVTPAKANYNLDAWKAGERPILVATMAKGGTGLSLHPQQEGQERVQVGLNLPWKATGVDQVSGRLARYGLRSNVGIEWLFAGNLQIEQQIATRVGQRMQDMGASVQGLSLEGAERLANWDFENVQNVRVGGRSVLESREGRAEDIYDKAERMSRLETKPEDTSGDFFQTPYMVSALMTRLAAVRSRELVLEPSAGRGRLLEFLPQGAQVSAVEQRADNYQYLQSIGDQFSSATFRQGDFLQLAQDLPQADVVLMNPPFSRAAGQGWQDAAHVRQAYDKLKENGRLVAVMGEGSFFRQDAQSADFRDWLDEVGATVMTLPEGTFRTSGTDVRSRLLVIDKDGQSGRSDLNLESLDDIREAEGWFPPRQHETQEPGPGDVSYLRPQEATEKGVSAQALSRALQRKMQDSLSQETLDSIHVVQSVQELPVQLYGILAEDQTLDTPALFYDREIYLVADNIPSLAYGLNLSLGHELFHMGLDNMREDYANRFGGNVSRASREVEQVLEQVADEFSGQVDALLQPPEYDARGNLLRPAGDYYDAYGHLDPATARRKAAEEYLAFNQNAFGDTRWHDRYISALRRFLRAVLNRLGQPLKLSKAEIRDFLQKANQSLRQEPVRQRAAGREVTESDIAPAYQRTGGLAAEAGASEAEREAARQEWAEKGTDSKYFKRWFGDSKVVDENGEPVVVYHGTQANFDSFDPNLSGSRTDHGWYGAGIYLTGHPSTASAYAEAPGNKDTQLIEDTNKTPAGSKVLPVYVSMENPYVIDTSDMTYEQQMNITREYGGPTAFSEALKEQGYDGVIATKSRDFFETNKEGDFYEVIAFYPTQIKSATGNIGTFDPQAESISFAAEAAPTFYSQMQSVLADKLPNRGLPRQMATQIKNMAKKGQFKQEELEWSGVEEWLGSMDKKTKVTRDQVLDYLKANEIQVQDVSKGQRAALDDLRSNHADAFATVEEAGLTPDVSPEGDRLGFMFEGEILAAAELEHDPDFSDAVWDAARRLEEAFEENLDSYTKYASYQVPGGERYHELLLKLPMRTESNTYAVKKDPRNGRWHVYNEQTGMAVGGYYDSKEAAQQQAQKSTADSKRFPKPKAEENYESPHWDEYNVLAHVRFNERTDADGNRVLFVEEVQSDWHQEGRKKGYKGQTEWQVKQLPNGKWTIGYGDVSTSISVDTKKEAQNILNSEQFQNIYGESPFGGGLPPNAPFKTTWPQLAMKRMLRYAAENGFDRIAWTPGEVQAERYQLSNQVDRIYVDVSQDQSPLADHRKVLIETSTGNLGDINLWVNKSGKVTQTTHRDFEGKGLDEIIGKEMADRIMALDKSTTLQGQDLKVGGEGMKGFYDKMLPSMLNKYVKKWGAKVEPVNIQTSEVQAGTGSSVRDIAENLYGTSDISSLTENQAAEVNRVAREEERRAAFGQGVPSIPITNQMREDVLTRGQPLFVAERSGTLEGYPEYPDVGQYRPREFARALGQWREKLQDWVKTAPDLLKFERAADHVRVVSRNTYPEGKPWRVTDFRKQDGQWVPTGHAERNSKSEAVEEAAQNARLAPEISFDALHDLAAESRAAPPTVQQVQEWIQPLQDAPGQVLPVNVVQSVQDLPQHLQERAQEIQGVPKAVLDRSAGQVTLIADNIADQKDAVLKWMHEQAGHYGFERMLGNNAVRHVLGSVRLIYGRSGLQDIMDVYGDDMHVAAREKFARIVEKVYAGEPLQRKERTIWQKFVDAVRNWLRARGIPVALSERELADLARSAIQYAQTGQIPPQAQAYSRAVQRGTQPRAQAPAMAPQAQAAIDPTEQFASEKNMGREHEEQVRQENPQRTKRTDQALGRERFDVQSMRQELQEDPELRSFLRNMFARRRGDPEVITTDLDRQDLSLLEEQIGVPYWLSKRFPVFRRIFDIHQSRLEERVEMQKDFMRQIQNPLSLRGKDLEHYRELVWYADGRQLVDVPLMQQKLDNQGRPMYEAGRPVLEINEAHYQALQQEMDRAAQEGGFSKDAVQAFMDTRRALDRAWLEVYDRMRKRSDVDDSSIEELRTWINRVHNYFPHHRYGRFYVQGYGKNQLEKTRQSWRVVSPLGEVLRSFKDKASAESWLEKNPRSVAYRAHFDAPLERMAKRKGQKLAKQAKQEYPDLEFEVGKNARLSEDIYAYPIPLEAIEQVLRAAKDRVKDADLQLELDKVMPGAVSDVLKSRGWAGHMIKRKNVPGYETKDVQRVLYDYFSGLAGWLTKMEAASQFSDALRDARQDAKRYPRLYQYSARYVRDMLENADRLDTVVDAYRSAIFIKYLGGVVKTGVLNLTQNPVAGVPALGTHIGQTRAHRRFFPQAARTVVNTAIKKAGGKEILSQDEAQMLDSLYRKGITDSLWLKEIRGSIGSRYGNYWDKFTSFMGYPVAVSDRFNRMSLALAAYRAARSGEITNPDTLRNLGLEKGQAATSQQAERFAREVVLDSHFVYGKGNRPQIIRGSGRAFSPLYSFRHFLHNLLSLYGHFFRDLSRNNLQGARALATSFGWTAALGGLTSLPLYQTLQAAMAFLFDEDETWAERMRDQIPDMPSGRPDMLRDMATYGLPSAAGVTFGGSLSIETPITRSLKPGSSMEEIVKDSLFNAGGAGLDLFFSPFRALSYQTSGDTSRALEEVAPGFMRNLLRTYRLTQEGTMSKSGQPLNLPWETGPRKLDSWEAVGQALGFQPLSSTKSWDVMQSLQLSRGVRRRTQQRLADNIIRALRDGDQERAGQYVRQWEQWNQRAAKEKKPWLKISDESLSRSLQARATDMNFPKRDLPRAAKLLQSYKD